MNKFSYTKPNAVSKPSCELRDAASMHLRAGNSDIENNEVCPTSVFIRFHEILTVCTL